MVGILPQDRSDPGRKDFCARAAAAERGERSVKSFPLRRWARSLPSGSAVQGGDEGRGEKEVWETCELRNRGVPPTPAPRLESLAERSFYTQIGPSQASRTHR